MFDRLASLGSGLSLSGPRGKGMENSISSSLSAEDIG
jgi:hypothetical protein